MTTHRALLGLLLAVTTVACAAQLDEPPAGADSPDPPGTAGSGASSASGAPSTGKGGSSGSAGNTNSGGATSSGGKGGTTSSGGKGGTSSGGQAGGGSGGSSGSSGSSTDGGSSGSSGSGGGTVSASCAGLPEWVAESNPNPAIQPGEAFTYMDQKFVLTAAMPVTYWNGECPPEPSRPTWCETNYAFTGPTPCE